MRAAEQLTFPRAAPFAFALTLTGLAACGGEQPAPQAPPTPPSAAPPVGTASPPPSAAIETGKDCAKAEGRCGGGTCDVTVKNDCDQAVRCELQVAATCVTQDGTAAADAGDRATVAAHETGSIAAQATCTGGSVVHTEVGKLTCR